MLARAIPMISGFTAREMSQLPTRLNPQIVYGAWGHSPLQTLTNRGHPSLQFTIAQHLGEKVVEKPSIFQTFQVLCNARNTLRTA